MERTSPEREPPPIPVPDVYKSAGFAAVSLSFDDTGERLVTLMGGDLRLWELPSFGALQRRQAPENGPAQVFARGDLLFASAVDAEQSSIRAWPVSEGEPRLIGTKPGIGWDDVDPPVAEWPIS